MKVIWSPRAVRNLEAVRDQITEDSEVNAAALAARTVECIELVATRPQMGRLGRMDGTREIVIPATRYVVPYLVRSGAIELIAIFHGHQRWPDTF